MKASHRQESFLAAKAKKEIHAEESEELLKRAPWMDPSGN